MSAFRCHHCQRRLSLRRIKQGATMHPECADFEADMGKEFIAGLWLLRNFEAEVFGIRADEVQR